MNEIQPCADNLQHCWVELPKGEGMDCYSCPSCGQVVYWSQVSLTWVRPGTSGGKKIPGNNQSNKDESL